MRDPTLPEVLDAIDKGIRKAQRDYFKAYMSDIAAGAPEYLTTVCIFQSILKLKDRCGFAYGLSLEEPVMDMVVSLRGKRVRIPRDARGKGECDLSIRNVDDMPLAAIEVKRNPWNCHDDLNRLAFLVKSGLKCGVFASCWFQEVKGNSLKKAKDTLGQEINFLHNYILDHTGKSEGNLYVALAPSRIKRIPFEGEKAGDVENWVWRPVIFNIRPKNNSR